MPRVLLDLNNPAFQETWFDLERDHALAVLASLRKIQQLNWEQFYADRGLRWEAILSKTGPAGRRIYSLRITRNMRAVAYREGEFLRFLSLHADHDSAYR
jgi:hypothetical protein